MSLSDRLEAIGHTLKKSKASLIVVFVTLTAITSVSSYFYFFHEAKESSREFDFPETELEISPLDPVTPEYQETLNQRDAQDSKEAMAEGTSYLPSFQTRAQTEETQQAQPKEPKIDTAAIEKALSQNIPTTPSDDHTILDINSDNRNTDRPSGEEKTDRLKILEQMMAEMAKEWAKPAEVAMIRYEKPKQEDPEASSEEKQVKAGESIPRPSTEKIKVHAGDNFYASVRYAINSDLQVPVILDIHEPPLTGAVLTGSFQQVREDIILQFARMTHQGKTYSINAYAVDFDCACFGIKNDDVDHHILERVIIPAAGDFASSFLKAASAPKSKITINNTTVTSEEFEDKQKSNLYEGAAGAIGKAASILNENAPNGPTIHYNRNREIAVVFVDSVAEE